MFNTAPVDWVLALVPHLPALSYCFKYDVLYGRIPGLEIQVSDDAFVSRFEIKHAHGDRLFNHVIYTKHLLATHVPWTEDGGERRLGPQGGQYGIV